MTLRMIDTHAHLDMSEFDEDREKVVLRAAEAGVDTIITVGIDMPSSQAAIALAERYAGIYAAVGFHPHETKLMQPADIDELAALAEHPKVVAIGEIGLDYYRMKSPQEIQLAALSRLLELATRMSLPVIIHSRQAEPDMLARLRDWTAAQKNKDAVGVIHCFRYDLSTAEAFLDMGFYIAFGAYIGYPKSRLADVIRYVPADRLLVETDCPYLPPQTHRGKRNEPAYIPQTVGLIAGIRNESLETVARQTTANACRLFRFPAT